MPKFLVHPSLTVLPDPSRPPVQQVAEVLILKDGVSGWTSYPAPPHVVAPAKGTTLSVSGDLALAWFKDDRAEPAAEPAAVPPVPQAVTKEDAAAAQRAAFNASAPPPPKRRVQPKSKAPKPRKARR